MTSADFTSILTQISTSFSIADIATIIAAIIGASGGIFLFWLGARKIVNAVTNTLSGGHLSI